MARLTVEQIQVLSDNYVYLLHDPGSGATAAVDPSAAEPVLAKLEEKGWRLTHILNTHHHHDHTAAISPSSRPRLHDRRGAPRRRPHSRHRGRVA